MAPQLAQDIWYMVVGILQTQLEDKNDRAATKASLMSLRLTNKFLDSIAAPALLSRIEVHKLDRETEDKLASLLRSPSSCSLVKCYDLRAPVIASRQGEQSSAYHKIPPHLDYGRQSSSKAVQEENRKLKAAAAQWEQQYRIIYPSKSKAAAAVKGFFKWSSTRDDPGLGDSVFLTALNRFSNLNTLIIRYPQPSNAKIIRDVEEEYNSALNNYLIQKPSRLSSLQLRGISPRSLVSLVRKLDPPGSEEPLLAELSELILDISSREDPNAGMAMQQDPGLGHLFSRLLSRMSNIETLSISYWQISEKTAKPLPMFLGLQLKYVDVPPLPNLTRLSMRHVECTAADLLALFEACSPTLQRLRLNNVSLSSTTWPDFINSVEEKELLPNLEKAWIQVPLTSFHSGVSRPWSSFPAGDQECQVIKSWIDSKCM